MFAIQDFNEVNFFNKMNIYKRWYAASRLDSNFFVDMISPQKYLVIIGSHSFLKKILSYQISEDASCHSTKGDPVRVIEI
jgi:hypothetical protein